MFAAPTVIGLDVSLTATGIATIFPSGIVDLTTVRSKPAGDTPVQRSRRIVRVRNEVAGIIKQAAPGLVVIEAHPYGVSGGHVFERGGLFTMIVHACDTMGIPVAEVNVAYVKKFATGKGSGTGTDKTAVAVAISRRWPRVQTETEHESDALALASMGAVRLRHDALPFIPTEPMRESLARVTWPTVANHTTAS